ncbi:MAG: hypothetical protein IKG14_04305 [Clostridia bacterium]|nr:hypothetical protein [Clostridia bacterium]
MKKKEVDYEIDENLYTVNSILQMIMQQYDEKIPEDVMATIEKASVLADQHLGKNFIPKADIQDMKLISRVTFDMDSLDLK